ncbi:hypothetical protein LXA43DRAFT_1101296 [Ganoderma leucocontextum]|nr:hypothetical protein LXA43DRAFT_1101296 [Ganoderma leucocontextum]
MSFNPLRRGPTPFHPVDSGSEDSRTIFSSPRTVDSPRSSASTAVSSWVDDVSSRSSTPSRSQWVTPLPPQAAATQPPYLLSPNTGRVFHPLGLPSHAGTGHYPQNPPLTSYASPPASNHGSVSSGRTASSGIYTRSRTRDRAERGQHSERPLESIPCQICLQPATMCCCEGGEDARLEMRKAAHEVFNRPQDTTDYRPTQRYQESQVAPQAGDPGYAQGFGYAAGYGAPMAYAGSPGAAHSEQTVAMGGYTAGYYASPGLASTSRTWVDEQQDSSEPVWGHRGGQS